MNPNRPDSSSLSGFVPLDTDRPLTREELAAVFCNPQAWRDVMALAQSRLSQGTTKVEAMHDAR